MILISDRFDDPAALEQGVARVKHRQHDVLILQTLDPAELTFPFRASMDFVGLEGEGRLGVDPQALRTAYRQALDQHLRQIQRITRKFKFDQLLLNTAESIGPPLSRFLARRAASINRGH